MRLGQYRLVTYWRGWKISMKSTILQVCKTFEAQLATFGEAYNATHGRELCIDILHFNNIDIQ